MEGWNLAASRASPRRRSPPNKEIHSDTAQHPHKLRFFTHSLTLSVETLLLAAVLTGVAKQAVAAPPTTIDEAIAMAFADPASDTVQGVFYDNVPAGGPAILPPADFFAMNPGFMLPVNEGVTADLDGDGIQDFVLPALASYETGNETQGRLIAYSGWTGDVLFDITNSEFGDLFSISLAYTKDLSGDGGDEVVVGAPFSDAGAQDAGRVYILNGADGQTLYTITSNIAHASLGLVVASAGDVNNDGVTDLLVSAPFDGTGKVYLFLSGSGLPTPASTGVAPGLFFPHALTTLDADMVFSGELAVQSFGLSVAAAGDVNGDTVPDVIIGAPHYDGVGQDEFDNRGRAYLYSGADGTLLGTITGDQPQQSLGYSVLAAGDVDANGVGDVLVGAPGALTTQGMASLFMMAPSGAQPFSRTANTANMIFTRDDAGAPTEDDVFGMSMTPSNDVDSDGQPDWIIYMRAIDGLGRVFDVRGYVYSGATGGFLYTFLATQDLNPPPPNNNNDGAVDQITIVLSNFGMNNATYQQGDLNGDTTVNTPDVIIALQNPNGTPPASTAGPGGGSIDCNQIIPMVDENGMPIDPCADPNAGGGGGGTGGDNPPSFFDTCVADTATPSTSFDCFLFAICAAGHEPGGYLDTLDQINADKSAAQTAYNQAIAVTKAGYDAANNAGQGQRAISNVKLRGKVHRRIGFRFVGTALIALVSAPIATEIIETKVFSAGIKGVVKGVKSLEYKEGAIVGISAISTSLVIHDTANFLLGKPQIDSAVASQNAAYQSAVAGPRAAFNAANDAANPALTAACQKENADKETAKTQFAMRSRELSQQCNESLGLMP